MIDQEEQTDKTYTLIAFADEVRSHFSLYYCCNNYMDEKDIAILDKWEGSNIRNHGNSDDIDSLLRRYRDCCYGSRKDIIITRVYYIRSC